MGQLLSGSLGKTTAHTLMTGVVLLTELCGWVGLLSGLHVQVGLLGGLPDWMGLLSVLCS